MSIAETPAPGPMAGRSLTDLDRRGSTKIVGRDGPTTGTRPDPAHWHGVGVERFRAVPDELREFDRWVLWRQEVRGGKPTKVPKQADGRNAKSNDPATWTTFDGALRALERLPGLFNGIGIVIPPGHVGVDLDNSRDPATGAFADWAAPHVASLETYGEVSPSLTGAKFIARGVLPGKAFNKKFVADGASCGVEMYDATSPRFFTITGSALDGCPGDVRDVQVAIDALYAAFTAGRPCSRPERSTSDCNRPGACDDQRVADAWAHVRGLKDAVSGAGGHNATFAAACACFKLGLSDAAAWRLMQRFNAEKTAGEPWADHELRHKLDDAKARVASADEFGILSRPAVVLGADEHRMVRETIDALASDPGLYTRGGALVRVVADRTAEDLADGSAGTASIGLVPPANLRTRITRYARIVRLAKDKESGEVVERPALPTVGLVNGVFAEGQWPGVRPLSGVSDVPYLRPDGSICTTPGYDKSTGVVYRPRAEFPPIPDGLTLDDADAAIDELLDPLCDFPFERDEHRAAALAAMLTPMARHGFRGPSPCFGIESNVRGSGKGKLAFTLIYPNLGREPNVTAYTNDVDELRKRVTALAISGARVALLDNVAATFGNEVIDAALTSTRWEDRLLGSNTQVVLPLTATWFLTGNNVRYGADTARRVIPIKLERMEERPEELTGFRYPSLEDHVRQNYPRLLIAGLTVLSAFVHNGRPEQRLKPFGSFEGWSDLVRSALVWAGQPDPCDARLRLMEQADETADVLGELMNAWAAYVADHRMGDDGLVLSRLLSNLYDLSPKPQDPTSAALRAALEQFAGCPTGKPPQSRVVGGRLRGVKKRVCRGRYFDFNPDEPSREGVVWRLRSAAA